MKKVLWLFIAAYILYFSIFTVQRFHALHASYFDLGIMNQAVYNTYQAIRTGDMGRILEITDPLGTAQVKRMAVHNDLILALLAPFYFLYNSPATLLVIQAVIVGLGGWFVYLIAQHVLKKSQQKNLWSLLVSLCFLLYVPLQRANIFEFHPVTLATTFLLGMFYYWLAKKQARMCICIILALLTKEQVGLTVGMFGLYAAFHKDKNGWIIVCLGWGWSLLSTFGIIPYFNKGAHFAASRYDNINIVQTLLRKSTVVYFWNLFAPVGLLSLLAPAILFIVLPEFAINLLSQDPNMRNIYYHYTAVITPFIFIAAIYGLKTIDRLTDSRIKKYFVPYISYGMLLCTLGFAYFVGPLPFALPSSRSEAAYVKQWAGRLKSDSIKVASTGHIAPFFTSRRYFYNFSAHYDLADYVIITTDELRDPNSGKSLEQEYKMLIEDPKFKLIDTYEKLEVYGRVSGIKY